MWCDPPCETVQTGADSDVQMDVDAVNPLFPIIWSLEALVPSRRADSELVAWGFDYDARCS